MANELAVGYISIIPETSKIAPGVKSALGQAQKESDSQGQSMGSKLAGGIGKTMKAGALATGAAVGGVLATSIAKGFKRLNALDQAEAKFKGLGVTGGELSSAMDSVSKSVKGTSFGLDEAAGSAAKLNAVGVETGKSLDRAMTLTADIAAQAGTSMDDVSSIMAKIAGAGKVTGETLAQLDDRATGAGAAIADHLGVSIDEMREKVAAGEVSFEDFQIAMEKHLGGAAQKTGETFSGAFANMGAAAGRLGANLLSPAFTAAPALFGSIGKAFDSMGESIQPAMERLGTALTPAMERLGVVIEEKIAPAVGKAAGALADFVAGLVVDGLNSDIWGRIGESFGKIASAAGQAWPSVSSLLQSLGSVAANLSVATWEAFANILNAVAPLISNVVVPALTAVSDVAAKNPGAVQALATAFLGFRAVKGVVGPVTDTAKALKGVVDKAKDYGSALKTSFEYAGQAAPNAGKLGKAWIVLKGNATAGLQALAKSNPIIGGMSKGLKALWGVMAANPIIAVVAAIAAVTAGLTWFFTKTEAGKKAWAALTDFMKSAWESVSSALSTGWQWIQQNVFEPLKNAFETIKSFMTTGDTAGLQEMLGLGEDSMVITVINGLRDGFIMLKDFAVQAWDAMSAKWQEFTTGFGQFYNTWVQPIINVATTAFGVVRDVVGSVASAFGTFASAVGTALSTASAIVSSVVGWIVERFQSIATALQPVTDAIGTVFSRVGEIVRQIWEGSIKAVFDAIRTAADLVGIAFQTFGQVVRAAFSAVGQIIRSVYDNLIKPPLMLFRQLAGLLADVLTGNFSNIGNRFRQLGGTLKNVVLGPIRFAFDQFKAAAGFAKNAFNAFKDGVGRAKDRIVSYLSDMVKKFLDVPGKIKSAFASAGSWLADAGRNLIQGFANGIRSATGWIVDAIKGLVPSALHKFLPFADGGFFFLNGSEDHRAMIAGAGNGRTPFRVWAEPETGGEAYIPLAPSKRTRSTAILATVADKFGMTVVGKHTGMPVDPRYRGNIGARRATAFADGGITSADVLSWVRGRTVHGMKPPGGRSLEGAKYVWGGGSASNWGDCSGAMSLIAGFVKGFWKRRPLTRLFATSNEGSVLASMGAKQGLGQRKDFNIAWFNGGSAGGHTSGDVGGVALEMGGGRGNGQIGGRAANARHKQYTHRMHFVLANAPSRPAAKKPAPATGAGSTSNADVASTSTTEISSSGGTSNVNWGKAQELYSQAADFLGVGRASYSAPQTAGSSAVETRDPHTPNKKTGVPQGDKPRPTARWGQPFFTYEIARAAKEKRLPSRGAMIGVGTALVESGDPMRMWANRAVPESLAFKHDAVGSDHDSVGLFQQRANGAWGSTADRMSPFKSAGMFFAAMLRKFPKWQSMAPGAVAQGVQVSAFPARYAGKMDRAMALVRQTRLYDQGGVLPHRGMSVNLSRKPEAVLTNSQWANFARSTRATESLATSLQRGLPEFQALAKAGPDAWVRTAAAVEKLAYSGDFTGAEPFDEDSVFTDIGLRLHEIQQQFQAGIDQAISSVKTFGLTVGGGFISKAEIVRDAEAGLEQTREQIAAETIKTAELEKDLAEARAELSKARAKGATLSTAQARRLADAEEALAKARKVKDASKRAEAMAKAQKRLDRVNEDIAEGLEKSANKNAEAVKKAMAKVSKAEGALTAAQMKQADAALRLESAERTVAAARYKAIGDLAVGVVDAVAKGAGTVAAYAESMAKLAGEVEKVRQEVSKLAIASVNARWAAMEAVSGLRTSETDLAKARWEGLVSVARAEATLAKERRGHLTMGAESIQNLASAVDRFRVAGVDAADDILLTWVEDQGLVLEAEWALKQARAEAALAQQEASLKQRLAQINMAQATMEQIYISDQLRLQTALLAQQQAATFGVGVTQMGALQRMGLAVQKIFTGLAKVIGGIATAVAGFAVAGPLGAIPGVITALSGIPDLAGGISGAIANRKEAKSAWKNLDKGAKAAAGVGIAGAALSGAAGIAAGTVGGLGPDAITGGLQVGNGILDATFGSLTQVAEARMEAITAEHTKRMDELQRSYDLDKALLESQKAGLQAGSNATLEKLRLDVEVAKIGRELGKAKADKEDAHVITALETALAQATAQQTALTTQIASSQAHLDAATKALETTAKDQGKTIHVTLNGDNFTSTQVEDLARVVEENTDNINIRLTTLEKRDAPGAMAYANARR